MSVLIELIGGPADGRLFAVPDPVPRVLELPVPPPSLLPLLRGGIDPLGPLDLDPPRPLRYEWDGTVREDGVRRFRIR